MEKPSPSARDLAAYLICLSFFLLALWLFFRYLFPILLPFLVAWALAYAVRPLALRIGRGTRIPNRILRLVLALLLFGLVGFAAWGIGVRLVRELQKLLATLTAAGEGDPLDGVFSQFPWLAGSAFGEQISGAVRDWVHSLTSHLPTLLSRLMSGVPRAVVALTVTLISCVYFCLDMDGMHAALLRILPERFRERVLSFKNGVFRMGGLYLRSYLTLMGITFLEMLVGLALLRVDYALLLAALIALVDFLPVLGVGTVLVPWSLFCFITGSPGRGVWLLVLWGISATVRQFLEPRLIGHGLGIHPCLTLFAMFAGLRLFGVMGMLLGPPLAALLFAWLPKPEKEPNEEISERSPKNSASPHSDPR